MSTVFCKDRKKSFRVKNSNKNSFRLLQNLPPQHTILTKNKKTQSDKNQGQKNKGNSNLSSLKEKNRIPSFLYLFLIFLVKKPSPWFITNKAGRDKQQKKYIFSNDRSAKPGSNRPITSLPCILKGSFCHFWSPSNYCFCLNLLSSITFKKNNSTSRW